ncbi:MAG TPA: hypothetical protein VLA04_06085 [Verrucomicrobiae bacterium]|nr:hypothetical protein [Verrucomicrobiae bacterium]
MLGVAIGLAALAASTRSGVESHTFLAVIMVGTLPMTTWKSPSRSFEEISFEELRQACLDGDPLAAFAAHTRWLSSLDVDDAAVEAIFDAFPEWVDMQKAVESPDCCWYGEALLKVVEHQRSELLTGHSC